MPPWCAGHYIRIAHDGQVGVTVLLQSSFFVVQPDFMGFRDHFDVCMYWVVEGHDCDRATNLVHIVSESVHIQLRWIIAVWSSSSLCIEIFYCRETKFDLQEDRVQMYTIVMCHCSCVNIGKPRFDLRALIVQNNFKWILKNIWAWTLVYARSLVNQSLNWCSGAHMT